MQATGLDFDQLEDVKPGDEIIVRFKPEGHEDLQYVLMMINAGVLAFALGDLIFLEAVALSADWNGDRNRTQTFTPGPNWNREFFEGRMQHCLEWIEVRKS
jgi:hypothetical protein